MPPASHHLELCATYYTVSPSTLSYRFTMFVYQLRRSLVSPQRSALSHISSSDHQPLLASVLQTGEIHCLPRITFSFKPARCSWTVNRKQFPLRPAYATTFNGCRRLTWQKAVLTTIHCTFESAMSLRHSGTVSNRE
ncbi:uncharacterized protein F5891DRAFT_346740 [Suillus fuscotomentosus]|uniref:Uncharacterized protein n=1 Tax=Suillus fuscotomentosus TaxID=1912939 RepID=A0AAD4EKW6_9AGAM|nr:uncharacterized protein F5891DRAFT_346740 [Suillus fuscotomentosus]KAG1906888.1 hypothetical protein F5891DRAFT_346740 [Suillus fuscotomentosus]